MKQSCEMGGGMHVKKVAPQYIYHKNAAKWPFLA